MEKLKFITEEVLGYMRSQVVKNSYDIVSVAQMMPTFEGFLTPLSSVRTGRVQVRGEHRRTVHQL